MQTFRFPKTFPRISLISLPEATTLHPATENPTGSLAAPRTAGTLPEQPDHPPPGSAVTVTLGKPEPHRWPADAVPDRLATTTMAPRCCPRSNAEPTMLHHYARLTATTGHRCCCQPHGATTHGSPQRKFPRWLLYQEAGGGLADTAEDQLQPTDHRYSTRADRWLLPGREQVLFAKCCTCCVVGAVGVVGQW
jgi:hypothetical protein